MQEVFLGRQPILDRLQRLVAYELLFRSGEENASRFTDDVQATTSVISNTFGQMGVQAVLGTHKGYINVDEQMLWSNLLDLLPPRKVVLELLETVVPSKGVLRRCRELRAEGFSIALDDFAVDSTTLPLLEVADIVKIDLLQHNVSTLEAAVRTFRRWPVRLLAEKVDSEQMARYCMELGFELFQGYYFARPSVLRERRQEASAAPMIRLLELLLHDAEIKELEKVFKQHPDLTYRLLRLVNSAASGLSSRISSVTQALLLVGRRELQRWLQLLLFTTDSKVPYPSPLLQTAATRARMMENLAVQEVPGNRALHDKAFMTGLLSLADVLLGWSREEVVFQLGVAEDVAQALQTESGLLGQLLKISCWVEANDRASALALLHELENVDLTRLNRAHMDALAWVNEIIDSIAPLR